MDKSSKWTNWSELAAPEIVEYQKIVLSKTSKWKILKRIKLKRSIKFWSKQI